MTSSSLCLGKESCYMHILFICSFVKMEEFKDDIDSRALLVKMIKYHSVVMNKSMLPEVKKAKEKAWNEIKRRFAINTGKAVSIYQLKKVMYNMKMIIKKKTELNTTGNKAVRLLPWESDFANLMNIDLNLSLNKKKGCKPADLQVSISRSPKNESDSSSDDCSANLNCCSNSYHQLNDMLFSNTSTTASNIEESSKANCNKKRKLDAETKETSRLTTSELQRWLLLEQIKLTKIQIEKEQLLLQRERKRPTERLSSESTLLHVLAKDEEN